MDGKMMRMMRALGLAWLCFVLIACRRGQQVLTPSAVMTPTAPAVPLATLTPTLPPSNECVWDWGTRPLPELSAQVQAALVSAGVPEATVSAVAYGEDCIDPQTGEVKGFALLETDFYFTVPVDSLANEPLGNMAEKVLTVLDRLPPQDIPGPQPGYMEINFVAGSERYHLWFEVTLWREARRQGLHGAALLGALSRPFAETPTPSATPQPAPTSSPAAQSVRGNFKAKGDCTSYPS